MSRKARTKISKKSALTSIENQPLFDSEGNQLWAVEKILEHKKKDNKSYYFVKWLGWSDKENTWEPKENLKFVKEMVHEFRRRHGLPPASDEEGDYEEEMIFKEHRRGASTKVDSDIEEIFDPRIAKQSKKIRKDTQSTHTKRLKPFLMEEDEEKENYRSKGKIFGTFETDQAIEVQDHVIYVQDESVPGDSENAADPSKLMFLIKWAKRVDNCQPESTWYSSADVKERCADKLANYYEKFIKFTS